MNTANYNTREIPAPPFYIYQTKLLSHVRLETLQARINDWLRDYGWNIAQVQSVALTIDHGFHYAVILYTERDTP